MSPPEPIEELNDQQLSVIEKLRTAMTRCLVFVVFRSVSIKTSDYFTSASTGAQDENRTHDLRITSAFESKSSGDWRREESTRIACLANFGLRGNLVETSESATTVRHIGWRRRCLVLQIGLGR